MEILYDIDEEITNAQQNPNILERLDQYYRILNQISKFDSYSLNLTLLNQVERITYDLSEIAKKRYSVLNKDEIIQGHQRIRKMIKEYQNPESESISLLSFNKGFSAFLAKYSRGVLFMRDDINDQMKHPHQCHIDSMWILIAFVSISTVFLAIQKVYLK